MNIHSAIKYLSKTASAEQRKRFETWLNQDEEHRSEFRKFSSFWEHLGEAYKTKEIEVEKGWELVKLKTIHAGQKSRKLQVAGFRVFMRIASVIILLLAVSLIYIYKSQPERFGKSSVTYVATDNINSFLLPDGSSITLNDYSALEVSKKFNSRYRKVKLSGEGFFEVASDASKPFIVYAGNTIVRVVGTSFNIRSVKEENKILVTVTSGNVLFYPRNNKSKKLDLTKGEEGAYNLNDENITEVKVSNQNYSSWKTGVLDFKDSPLAEVIGSIEKTYKVKIVAEGDLSQATFTGRFDNVPLDEVLEVLELTLDITFEGTQDKIKLTFN